MTIRKAFARTWTDADYKTKLLSDPHAALADAGVEVPAGTTVQVVEDTANTQHVVLPVAPAGASNMSIEELTKVAGGESGGEGGTGGNAGLLWGNGGQP